LVSMLTFVVASIGQLFECPVTETVILYWSIIKSHSSKCNNVASSQLLYKQ